MSCRLRALPLWIAALVAASAPPLYGQPRQVKSRHARQAVIKSLPAPTSLLPQDGATGVPPVTTLRWAPVRNARGYRIVIARRAADLPLKANADGCRGPCIVNTKIPPGSTDYNCFAGTLEAATTYYWTVHALHAGFGQWSTASSFTTEAPAPSPAMPPASATGTATGTPAAPATPTVTSTATSSATRRRSATATATVSPLPTDTRVPPVPWGKGRISVNVRETKFLARGFNVWETGGLMVLGAGLGIGLVYLSRRIERYFHTESTPVMLWVAIAATVVAVSLLIIVIVWARHPGPPNLPPAPSPPPTWTSPATVTASTSPHATRTATSIVKPGDRTVTVAPADLGSEEVHMVVTPPAGWFQTVASAAWPLTVLVILLAFRREIRMLLERLRPASDGPAGAELTDDRFRTLVNRHRRYGPDLSPADYSNAPRETILRFQQLEHVADAFPRRAVLDAWEELQRTIDRILVSKPSASSTRDDDTATESLPNDPDRSGSQIQELLRRNHITDEMFVALSDLRLVRDRVVECTAFQPSHNNARSFVEVASGIARRIYAETRNRPAISTRSM